MPSKRGRPLSGKSDTFPLPPLVEKFFFPSGITLQPIDKVGNRLLTSGSLLFLPGTAPAFFSHRMTGRKATHLLIPTLREPRTNQEAAINFRLFFLVG